MVKTDLGFFFINRFWMSNEDDDKIVRSQRLIMMKLETLEDKELQDLDEKSSI